MSKQQKLYDKNKIFSYDHDNLISAKVTINSLLCVTVTDLDDVLRVS
jgi:hypothetical protein